MPPAETGNPVRGESDESTRYSEPWSFRITVRILPRMLSGPKSAVAEPIIHDDPTPARHQSRRDFLRLFGA
jgi:hypothetical protein